MRMKAGSVTGSLGGPNLAPVTWLGRGGRRLGKNGTAASLPLLVTPGYWKSGFFQSADSARSSFGGLIREV